MYLRLISCLIALAAAPDAWAQDKGDDPIDKTLASCLETADGAYLEQANCIDDASKAWDRELNLIYGKLMQALDAGGQERLKMAQRQWLAFRDSEIGLQDHVVGVASQGSTMGNLMMGQMEMELLRARAQALRAYKDILG